MKTPGSIPLDWFVCPVSKAPLKSAGDELVSSHGRYRRNAEFGYWDFMPAAPGIIDRPEWRTWQQLQDNGVVSYEADPEHNLGVGRRQDFLDFAAFCDFRGNVLDVGAGPQRCPTHVEYCEREEVFFVGIDPLAGAQPRCFSFVLGLGEFLPFRHGLFDQVLFVTSLDHFIDPRPPLEEAKRVLRRGGDIGVWIGEKHGNAPRPTVTNEWYEKLQVPPGAEDRFHFKRFTSRDFEGYLADAGLVAVDRHVIEVDEWRSNLFYRARPAR